MVPKHDVSKLEDLPHVTLLDDADGNLHLRNLSVHCVASEEEALNLLFLGDTNRIVSETPMNPHSSRSHCVFTMHLASHNKHSSTVRRCKLNLVDLAGSERVYKSQIDGRTLVEARNINLSLHFLEQVILALGETGRNHIPYRNSIMTSILRDSLGGNCLTVMVATLSVSSNNTEETVSTCRFAQRVAFVHNEVSVNEELDPQKEIAMLRAEVHELRGQLARLSGERESSELSSIDIEDCQNLVKQYLQSEPGTSEFGLLHNEKKVQLCYSFLKDAMLKAQERVKHQESEQMQMEQKFQEHIQQRDREISILISLLKKEKKRYQEAMAQNDKETGSLQRLEFISSTDEFPVLMSHFEEPVAEINQGLLKQNADDQGLMFPANRGRTQRDSSTANSLVQTGASSLNYDELLSSSSSHSHLISHSECKENSKEILPKIQSKIKKYSTSDMNFSGDRDCKNMSSENDRSMKRIDENSSNNHPSLHDASSSNHTAEYWQQDKISSHNLSLSSAPKTKQDGYTISIKSSQSTRHSDCSDDMFPCADNTQTRLSMSRVSDQSESSFSKDYCDTVVITNKMCTEQTLLLKQDFQSQLCESLMKSESHSSLENCDFEDNSPRKMNKSACATIKEKIFETNAEHVYINSEPLSSKLDDNKTSYEIHHGSFMENLPLTGDPEIDEEIIAFYRARSKVVCE